MLKRAEEAELALMDGGYVVRSAPLAATTHWITDLAAVQEDRLARITQIAAANGQ